MKKNILCAAILSVSFYSQAQVRQTGTVIKRENVAIAPVQTTTVKTLPTSQVSEINIKPNKDIVREPVAKPTNGYIRSASIYNQPIEISLPGGGKIYRTIQSNVQKVYVTKPRGEATTDRMLNKRLTATEGRCNYYTAKVSTVEKGEMMTISNGNLIENFAPGLIYDVKELFNGDILNKEKFPYAQNRNPVQLTTTVRNFTGNNNSVSETINMPDKVTINQAIANFYARHTTRADRTSIQNARFYSCAINSSSEFALKIGASGHYMFYSGEANFSMYNAESYKSLYFEATKELFTISARPATQAGFFNADPGNTANLGYISAVTYGVRIIGKVDVENKTESMQGDLKAAFEMGIAGAQVNMSTYKTNSSSKSVVTLYAVGGRCDKIGVCTVENIQQTIDEFLRTANYQVAQPIKLQFSTLDGQLMRFMDATDNFTFKECTPPALVNAPEDVVLSNLHVTAENPNNNDYDFYGRIWVMAYDRNHVEIPAVRGANKLMEVSGENEIDLDDPAFSKFSPGTSVTIHFPQGRSSGAYLKIYYVLFDEDANTDYGTGDDDQFAFRNYDAEHQCDLGETSRRWCVRTVYLDKISNSGVVLEEQLWNAADQTGLRINMSMTRIIR